MVFIIIALATVLLTALLYQVFILVSPPIVVSSTGEIHRTMPIGHMMLALIVSAICGLLMIIKYVKHLKKQ